MVASSELDSFIRKFHQLWSAGYSAHLDVGTTAGQAWVGLRVQLGAENSNQGTFFPHPKPKKRFGPSRIRRRNRRAAARAAMNADDINTEEVVTFQEPSESHPPKPTEEVAKEATITSLDMGALSQNELANSQVKNRVEAGDCSEVSTAEIEVSDIVKVCCIATLENCPDERLDKAHADSIRNFLFNEKHLLENVKSSKLDHLSSRSFRNGMYVHTITVTLSVKSSKLQENPTEYIKRYLGTQMWTWANGTEMRLSKIHQKKEPG